MKRFALFAGPDYYPSGGWRDLAGSFDSIEAAKAHVEAMEVYESQWWHVVDLETREIAESGKKAW